MPSRPECMKHQRPNLTRVWVIIQGSHYNSCQYKNFKLLRLVRIFAIPRRCPKSNHLQRSHSCWDEYTSISDERFLKIKRFKDCGYWIKTYFCVSVGSVLTCKGFVNFASVRCQIQGASSRVSRVGQDMGTCCCPRWIHDAWKLFQCRSLCF